MAGPIAARYKTATILQVLAPLTWGPGLWLIFLNVSISGSACSSCASSISIMITSLGAVPQVIVGTIVFLVGMMMYSSSLGILASKTNDQAERWLFWLLQWKPIWQNQDDQTYPITYRYLISVSLFASLVLAILLIPGIGEDRQFTLNQFFDLWGTVWYLYVFSMGTVALALVYFRRPGGYILSLIFSLIPVGMNIPDLLGLLPPSPPTLRTSVLLAAGLPFSILGAYSSLKTIRD